MVSAASLIACMLSAMAEQIESSSRSCTASSMPGKMGVFGRVEGRRADVFLAGFRATAFFFWTAFFGFARVAFFAICHRSFLNGLQSGRSNTVRLRRRLRYVITTTGTRSPTSAAQIIVVPFRRQSLPSTETSAHPSVQPPALRWRSTRGPSPSGERPCRLCWQSHAASRDPSTRTPACLSLLVSSGPPAFLRRFSGSD